ncbi:hypothetical protein J437_LFUL011995 [Ladona fulva]|uniref:Reverse transcriptase domain-containing protein n=1 Tax=Ladona fulva TaxID=123851 RepID=A0A8K0KIV8_LADFU|nr:hypothetical protein J437_LFUL011995 [Ladona fulva]
MDGDQGCLQDVEADLECGGRNHIPDDWTKALVIVIREGGSKTSLDNYKPISLTSQICKLMEKMMEDYLCIADGKQLRQHGFRQGNSCETQLLRLVHDKWYKVDMVIIDFVKALDAVSTHSKVHELNADHQAKTAVIRGCKQDKQNKKLQQIDGRVRTGETVLNKSRQGLFSGTVAIETAFKSHVLVKKAHQPDGTTHNILVASGSPSRWYPSMMDIWMHVCRQSWMAIQMTTASIVATI